MAIEIGKTKFRDTVMDYNPYFVVRGKKGRGVWRCVSEDEHYGGVERLYSTKEIEAKVNWENMFAGLDNRRASFWDQQPVGTVLHYDNAFEEYVRGVVVEIDGEKKLKPIALIGDWNKSDLPHRRPNGEISYGYHAKKILEGGDEACWQPSDGCVYESPSYTGRGKMDPRKLEPISLEVPPMTDEEATIAVLERKIDRVREIVNNRYQNSDSAEKVLADITKAAQGSIR